jgi:hypothetical protein
MGRKVFVSYKYKDEKVARINEAYYEEVNGVMQWNYRYTRVRDYVDVLQKIIGKDNINLGEKDGESLANFSDEAIATTLKKRIAQCSITIVLISKGMKTNEPEKEQWIPWEISYSLRTVSFKDFSKQMNAVLGVLLPDETGTYDWYYTDNSQCNSITHNYGQLFDILQKNMFNINKPTTRECNGSTINEGEFSFIKTIKWESFIYDKNSNQFIEKAIEIKDNKDLYDYHINLE